MKTQQLMEILGVVNRGEGKKGFWTKIGLGFRNRDESSRSIPMRPQTTRPERGSDRGHHSRRDNPGW